MLVAQHDHDTIPCYAMHPLSTVPLLREHYYENKNMKANPLAQDNSESFTMFY
jgi:hypothetical protein